MLKTIDRSKGPLLVAVAAFLWATDALFRFPIVDSLDPVFVVWVEHVLMVILLLPWIVYKYGRSMFNLNPRDWGLALFCGVGGSALAMVFFTDSFLYLNPSLSVLLQKLQPVMVVMIAYLFLGERPAKKFYFWGALALAAGILLSFPDLDFKFVFSTENVHSKGIKYSLLAAALWSAATVGGKVLLKKTPTSLALFWRFFFGLVTLMLLIYFGKGFPSSDVFKTGHVFFGLFYLSVFPGVVAMAFYYTGLSKTSASVTTIIELLYPVGAVILNTIFLHTQLSWVQVFAGAALLLAAAKVSF